MPHAKTARPARRHYVSSLRRFDRGSTSPAPASVEIAAEGISDRASAVRTELEVWHEERAQQKAESHDKPHTCETSILMAMEFDRAMGNIRSLNHDPKYRHARIRPGYREAMPPGPPAA
jgi:hypothetical protein